jgi:hypothetical protein
VFDRKFHAFSNDVDKTRRSDIEMDGVVECIERGFSLVLPHMFRLLKPAGKRPAFRFGTTELSGKCGVAARSPAYQRCRRRPRAPYADHLVRICLWLSRTFSGSIPTLRSDRLSECQRQLGRAPARTHRSSGTSECRGRRFASGLPVDRYQSLGYTTHDFLRTHCKPNSRRHPGRLARY